jgi:rhodanese-related sulfurtransferase
MMRNGTDIKVLDSRPFDEYARISIPTGINVPGAELVLRVRDIVPSPGTTIVVNCAGRTRSIIGAQSLINAGVPNKVVALRNGTMGWHLRPPMRQRQDHPGTGRIGRWPEVGEIGGCSGRAKIRC